MRFRGLRMVGAATSRVSTELSGGCNGCEGASTCGAARYVRFLSFLQHAAKEN